MAIGTMWSITLPLQGPLGDPVAGVLVFELNLGTLAALDTGRGTSQHQGQNKKDELDQAILQLKIRSGLTPPYPHPPVWQVGLRQGFTL